MKARDGLVTPDLDDPIPLSALQHAVYCLRQAALIHIERLWVENVFTAEGHVVHAATDQAGVRRSKGVRRITALPISSRRLNISGVADLVEFHAGVEGETAFPVEIKRGKPKMHRADEVQLCAQALCLEEMTSRVVPRGALFYAQTRRRVEVQFDTELRELTEDTTSSLRDIFETGKTPPAVYRSSRCRNCSLIVLCRPKTSGKSALAFRDRMVRILLNGDSPDGHDGDAI